MSFQLIWLSFLCLVILVLAYLIKFMATKLKFWSKYGVRDKELLDYIGLFGEQHKYCVNMSRKYGRIYGGFMLTKMFIVINEPDIIRELFIKHFVELPNHTHFNLGESQQLNDMLFFLPGNDKWKRIRSVMTPAFNSGKLKAMMAKISDISDNFVESLEVFAKTEEVFDVRKHVGAFAMDVVCACAYGINIDSINNPNHPVIRNVMNILNVDANLNMAICVLAPKFARLLRLNFFEKSAIDFLTQFILQIMDERKRSGQNYQHDKKITDFIQLMLDSEEYKQHLDFSDKYNDLNIRISKNSLTLNEIIAQGISFFVAGYDTTSSALTHLVYYLSENKDCQQLLYEELKDFKQFSYENLSELKYLNAVIDETLRLAPPLLRIQRQGPNDFEISGIRIPANTSIEILPYALHRDPEFWPDPLKFKPDRFLNPTHHPWAYIPFGGGPRICIGKRFSLNEMRMCCAKLFFKYEFSLAPDFKLEYFKPNVILSLKSMMVKIKSRNQK